MAVKWACTVARNDVRELRPNSYNNNNNNNNRNKNNKSREERFRLSFDK